MESSNGTYLFGFCIHDCICGKYEIKIFGLHWEENLGKTKFPKKRNDPRKSLGLAHISAPSGQIRIL